MNNTKAVLSKTDVINYFINHGCTIQNAMDMIQVAPHLLNLSYEQFEKTVSFLFNCDLFYGIIICNKNNWKEYISPQVYPNINGQYFAEIFINASNTSYIQNILRISPTDTLEDRLYKMKQKSFNPQGYNLK